MKILLLLAVFCILATTKMIFAFVEVRHGAEYPKNDLYDGNQTKQYRGQITPIGLRQHYNLGTYLRQNYIVEEGLTTSKYNPNQVQFYSTSIPRVHNSALAFAYGFYPLGQGWAIPDQVPTDKLDPPYTPLFPKNIEEEEDGNNFGLEKGYQPLPVRSLDSILANCPNYDALLTARNLQILQLVEVFQAQQRTQIAKMRAIFNLTAAQQNVQTMSDLYETLYADQLLGRPMPTQYTDSDDKNLKFIYQYYNSLVFDGQFARILSTPTLRMLLVKLDGAVAKKQLKFTFIAGHRSNVHPLAVILNLTNAECLAQRWRGETVTSLNCVDSPQFTANLIIELHEDDSLARFVRVKYNGEYVYLCGRRETKCSYEEFKTRVKLMEADFEGRCGIKEHVIKDLKEIDIVQI